MIALIEHLQKVRHVQQYKRRLGMTYANYNINGKIWLFINNGIQVEVMSDTKQTLTIKMFKNGHQMISTLVYAKCATVEIIEFVGRNLCHWSKYESAMIC